MTKKWRNGPTGWRLVSGCCLFLSLSSCLPIPHTTDVAPRIGGIIVDAASGTPIRSGAVHYSRGKYSEESKIGEDGSFNVGPLIQWHWLVYVGSPGHAPFPDSLRYRFPAELKIDCPACVSKVVTLGWHRKLECSEDTSSERFFVEEEYSEALKVMVNKNGE